MTRVIVDDKNMAPATGYSDVSNPFVGINFNLAWEHDRFGSVYLESRFINGFSFSNPSRGHPTVREARVAFGYLKQLTDNIAGLIMAG